MTIEQSASDTPGRPKDSGSRQQTHPNQGSQSGSPKVDRQLTDRGAVPKEQGTDKPGKVPK